MTRELMNVVRDVLAERERQKSVEGWTVEHDDRHILGEMGNAAAAYAMTQRQRDRNRADNRVSSAPACWPWSPGWWKPVPTNRRRDLVKAGALILAEIERLDRISHAGVPHA